MTRHAAGAEAHGSVTLFFLPETHEKQGDLLVDGGPQRLTREDL